MSRTKRSLRRRSALPLALGALSLFACARPEPTPPAQLSAPLSDAPDGDATIGTANMVVNAYAQLTVDAAVNATTITVDKTQLAAMGLKSGDLIMLYQAQGAQIGTTDDKTYGTIMTASGAGRFEFIGVTGVNLSTGVITLDTLCSGLKNGYSAAGNSQVVRVPQYGNLTVNAPGSIVPVAWNGQTGGIVAVRARHLIVAANASISASGKGFRGGSAVNAGDPATDIATFISSTNSDGGGKGEGIAGYFTDRFARGAAGNGGGGGNSFGAGGGGGGNGGSATGWQGNGVMNLHAAADAMSWALDPEAMAGNARTSEGGGGRGGYTQALATMDVNATTTGPDNAAWGGNHRRERGGRGGSPAPNSASSQIFFGGGGGAGAPTNNITAGMLGGDGGRGGGLIYVLAGKTEGDGRLVSNGAAGTDITAPLTHGPGGGGAGGTIVLNATSVIGNLGLQANGGSGGNQLDAVAPVLFLEAEGPGGGGGGGFVAVPASTPVAVQQLVSGGLGGITQSALLSEFPSNGATDGKDGLSGQSLLQGPTPICAPLDLRIAVTDGLETDSQGTHVTYLITVYNDGPFTAVAAPVTGTATPALPNTDWTCSTSSLSQDDVPASCSASQGSGDLNVMVTLPAGASASIVARVPVATTTSGTVHYQANIGVPSGVSDSNMGNNTAAADTSIGPGADLLTFATAAPAMTKSGQPITFILSVSNQGPNSADNVVTTFDIPTGATLIGDPIGDGWSCSNAQGLLTCTLPTLPRGPAPDITLTVLPDPNAAFATGSVHVSSDAADPDLSNNSATAVASITYDPTGFETQSLAGGGIGCSSVPQNSASPFGGLVALLATAFMLARRRLLGRA